MSLHFYLRIQHGTATLSSILQSLWQPIKQIHQRKHSRSTSGARLSNHRHTSSKKKRNETVCNLHDRLFVYWIYTCCAYCLSSCCCLEAIPKSSFTTTVLKDKCICIRLRSLLQVLKLLAKESWLPLTVLSLSSQNGKTKKVF